MPKKLTKLDFLKRSLLKHANFYNYDEVVFINTKTKVEIVCPLHGIFLQTPEAHMRGQGCPVCGNLKSISHKSKDVSTFIQQAQKEHNNKYNYSKVNYINCMTKVDIICSKHGVFKQTPNNHLRGAGCPLCAREKSKFKHTLSTKSFVALAHKVHANKYIYSDTLYIKSKLPVSICCPIHGTFKQSPDKHLRGQGCPRCTNKVSKPENVLASLFKDNNIKYRQSDRSLIKPYELDLVLSDFNLAIEYCGLYWHSEQALHRYPQPKNYHKDKYFKCSNKDYRLITIFEPEYLLKYSILESMLLAQCNIYKYKIGSRQCTIQEVSTVLARKFLEANHIQGFAPGRYIGLFYKDVLISLMVLFEYDTYYNLVRFVNKKHTLVHGSFSKLFKFFLKSRNNKPIITFADKRYFSGNVYINNGFDFVHEVDPSYYYFSNQFELLHKRNFQHKKLKSLFSNYDTTLTEYQNCLNNGYNRIWDCGKIKYIYN